MPYLGRRNFLRPTPWSRQGSPGTGSGANPAPPTPTPSPPTLTVLAVVVLLLLVPHPFAARPKTAPARSALGVPVCQEPQPAVQNTPLKAQLLHPLLILASQLLRPLLILAPAPTAHGGHHPPPAGGAAR